MAETMYEVGRGVTICAETFGDPSDPPVLLIMGLGMQMVRWHETFVEQLTSRGFSVIRFDNRDSGLSTFCSDVPLPTLRQLMRRRFDPRQYKLTDMARDTAGLIDALGLDTVHVVGASMGGMIAQTVAAEHPRRVRSLTSIMSNTGSRWSGQPALKSYPILLGRAPPPELDAYLARQIAVHKTIGSPGLPGDDPLFVEISRRSFERNSDPRGTARQLAAILASGDRTRQLRTISAPTLVIHGDSDRLVNLSGGRATARAIPGAELHIVRGMGHDLPAQDWPEVIGSIAHHIRSVETGRDRPRGRATA
ncbi:MAG TPA: alpha/beta hydrolase [Conexibacter sp.]|jgi:pimeloyl-ACP methyl ester carboxylesterase